MKIMHRPITEARSCASKKRYDCREDAEAVAEPMRRGNRFGAYRYQAYECRFCGGWHVGRRRVGQPAPGCREHVIMRSESEGT